MRNWLYNVQAYHTPSPTPGYCRYCRLEYPHRYIGFLLENDGKEKGAGWASFAHLGWAIVISLGFETPELSYPSSKIQGVLLIVVRPLDF